ncbi:S-adenosyl-L-methionine-dependent methyltransferase [Trametes punicea]|nr:S-adenosyl-L-methionine-dependent methyltransferase [Trametes punicea]
MPDRSPVELAEELLQLVKSIYGQTNSKTSDQEVYDAKRRAQQLSDTIRRYAAGPLEYTITLAESCHESAALRFVTEYGVADFIGDDTKTLSDICEALKVNPRYLSVALNCLLTHGYFEEVRGMDSRAFRNNAMSGPLREQHPQSLKAAIGFICDDGYKAAGYLVEAARVADRSVVKGAPTGLNLAFGFEGPAFQHWASPDHAWRGKRMGLAMKQLHQMANANVVTDFEWHSVQSPLVDLGGGIGTLEMALTEAYPESALHFIIVDIAETVKNAATVWENQPPHARRRISFVAGDFLAGTLEDTHIPCGQPTYLMRHILHDWADDEVVAILKNVRAAMLAPPSVNASAIDGSPLPLCSTPPRAPRLLICEMLLQERSGRFAYTTSVQVLALNNGIIRTEREMVMLLGRAGFAAVKIHNMRAADSIIEAVPSGL